MKIALALIGISSGIKNRDWNRTKLGIKEKTIDCWIEQGHEVKSYLFSNDIDESMIDFYKPIKHEITGPLLINRYNVALEQLEDQDVDFIICTRFDIVFFEEVCNWNLDFNKFNFLFREINHFYDGREYVCDNFFAFPKSMLKAFKQALNDPNNPKFTGMLHNQVYKGLANTVTENNIHFVQDEEDYSGYNKLYLLDRYHFNPGDCGPTTIEVYNRLTEEEIFEIKHGNFARWLPKI